VAEYLYQCPARGCMYRLLLWENEATTHPCPYGGHTHYGLSETMRLVEKCWIKLDAVMDKLMIETKAGKVDKPQLGESIWRSVDAQIKVERLKGEARGMAELLAEFMVPFFRTGDEIAAEAGRRWKARQSGEDYTTPGLGSRAFEFPQDDKYSSRKPANAPAVGHAAVKATPRANGPVKSSLPFDPISAKDKAGIKAAKGLMSAEDLAVIYKTTAGMIRKIWTEE
jgi:hypothetical protein